MKRSKLTQSQGHIESLERRTLFSGGMDPTFGTGGIAPLPGTGLAVATQPDGKIVTATLTAYSSVDNFIISRFNANGTVDSTFGTNGQVTGSVGTLIFRDASLLIQPDGKVVFAGDLGADYDDATMLNILRFNTNGSIDKTFGTNGTLSFSDHAFYYESRLLWQDGKLLVASPTVYRLNANGTIDSTFHQIDASFGRPGEVANVFAVQPNQKILIDVFDSDVSENDLVYRFNANGMIDTTFGTAGIAAGAPNGEPIKIVVAPTGTIFELAGGGFPHGSGPSSLTELQSNGKVNTAFGTNGSVGIPEHYDRITYGPGPAIDVNQQPDGKLLVTVPELYDDSVQQYDPAFEIVGFTNTGVLDSSFGTAGVQTYFHNGGAWTATLDGSRLIVGTGQPSLFAIDTNNDTGTIAGYMFYDFNGNGKRDPGDHALNWTCYIDVDNDGHYDNADIRIHTDAAGNFVIPNLAPGVYHIRQSGVSHWQKTTPAEYTVTVTTGATVTGVDFGSREIS